MSFKLMVQAFEARVGNPLRKLVLIKLADQANDNGVCWPSYETLAFHCETTRRSVITHVKQLEADGFLRVERVYDKEAGKNKSNRYHLTIEKESLSDGENNSLVKEFHHPSENISPPLVKEFHHPSEGASPKPITESINIESINEPVIAFDEFWEAYDKKIDRTKCLAKWEKLSEQQHQEIMSNVHAYVAANNVKQYRKNPLTYLNGECWLDEIITSQPTKNNQGLQDAKQSKLNELEQYINSYGTEQEIRHVN